MLKNIIVLLIISYQLLNAHSDASAELKSKQILELNLKMYMHQGNFKLVKKCLSHIHDQKEKNKTLNNLLSDYLFYQTYQNHSPQIKFILENCTPSSATVVLIRSALEVHLRHLADAEYCEALLPHVYIPGKLNLKDFGKKNKDIFIALMKNNHDTNFDNDEPCIHFINRLNDEEASAVLKYLIKPGADLNQHFAGTTILTNAITQNKLKLIQALMNYELVSGELNFTITDDNGEIITNAVDMCQKSNNENIKIEFQKILDVYLNCISLFTKFPKPIARKILYLMGKFPDLNGDIANIEPTNVVPNNSVVPAPSKCVIQ